MVTIDLVKSSNEVLIGNWYYSQIDIADILAAENSAISAAGFLGHEIYEQCAKQRNEFGSIEAIDHDKAKTNAENKIGGYYRGPDDLSNFNINTGTGKIVLPLAYTLYIANVTLNIVNYNVTSVEVSITH